MFDIGFSKILVIFVLALIVLGPEKLPKVASQVGRWIGRARGMARQFREQLEEEVNLEEVRRTQSANRTASESTPPPSASSTESGASATSSAASTSETGPISTSESGTVSPPSEPERPVYRDTYSHAHPTDDLGRPIPEANPEPAEPASGQQDWVGGSSVGHSVTPADKAAQNTANAAYAPSHERGT